MQGYSAEPLTQCVAPSDGPQLPSLSSGSDFTAQTQIGLSSFCGGLHPTVALLQHALVQNHISENHILLQCASSLLLRGYNILTPQ